MALTVTDIIYHAMGVTIAFSDGSVGEAVKKVVNGVLTLTGLTDAQTTALISFQNNISSTVSAASSSPDPAEIAAAALLEAPHLKSYSEAVNIMGSAGGARTLDISLGNIVTATSGGVSAWTFINPPATGKAGSFTLILTDGGNGAQTWPASVKWPGGVAPSLTVSGVDILTFITIDGGVTYRGVLSQADSR